MSPSLTHELAKRGFTHRAPTNPNHGGRVIVNGCGVAIGRVSSTEGWLWIRLGCPLDDNGFIAADELADAAATEEMARQENRPYVISLGNSTRSYHETFEAACVEYRKHARCNGIHMANVERSDVDDNGLTEDERIELAEIWHDEWQRANYVEEKSE